MSHLLIDDITLTETPLEIRKPLKNVETTEGDKCEFTFEVSKPGHKAQWLFQDVVIKPSNEYKISSVECTHTLTLENVELEDAGKYQVKVSEVHSSATLKVRGN